MAETKMGVFDKVGPFEVIFPYCDRCKNLQVLFDGGHRCKHGVWQIISRRLMGECVMFEEV